MTAVLGFAAYIAAASAGLAVYTIIAMAVARLSESFLKSLGWNRWDAEHASAFWGMLWPLTPFFLIFGGIVSIGRGILDRWVFK